MTVVDRAGQTVSATRFAELTGTSRERLRAWERRHGFPQPVRHAGGPRRYLLADVPRVVAVRQAAEQGVPIAAAIRRAGAPVQEEVSATAIKGVVELAPVPVALISGPEPLRVEYANSALRRLSPEPEPVAPLGGECGAVVRDQLLRDLPPAECDHEAWDGSGAAARSVLYRLPIAAGERPLVAMVGLETRAEREARGTLADRDAELQQLRWRSERHERWLDAIGALAREFQHEPGPDLMASALDVLIRQTGAVDGGLATYLSGSLALSRSRRGLIEAGLITVAAHPQLARALRDAEGIWLEPAVAGLLGVPDGVHAAGIPVMVAGETLGLLVMLFDEPETHDADNRRLLSAISAALGFALLRDRLAEELRETESVNRPDRRPRFARPPAGDRSPDG